MKSTDDDILRTVRSYYGQYDESSRLVSGSYKLEFARTCAVLERCLPPTPSQVYDIGGGPGAYAVWLANRGHHVVLVDPVEAHVHHAAAASVSGTGSVRAQIGDARALPFRESGADAVLLLGPLYHLPDREDRLLSLRESLRVLRPGGRLLAAAISRYASTLSGLFKGLYTDPAFQVIAARDRETGQHRNEDKNERYFTTSFFHHPNELRAEVEEAGFHVDEMCAIEGPAWLLPDFDSAWANQAMRSWILETADAFELEASALAISAHFVAMATKA